ncbi:MAG TPA: ATP-binding protein, partial [Candidatus Eisenbacteria bacterium]|nr:ATP-binding protein [Candidatus Eisenbacteria bacterium]
FSMVYEARAAALRSPDADTREALEGLERAAGAALNEMKALVYAVRPKSLERDGLEASLRDHVEALKRAHGAAIELRVHGELRLTPSQDLALLRIAQEALHNALHHAGGARVQVTLEQDADEARLTVRDRGPGFDVDGLPRSRRTMGLATMRERAAAVRARLEVRSAPGRGTDVRVRLRTVRRSRG